ncbi:MAG TPA: SDR family oxidoreductase [Gordonia sp. (in: high G+C Gram-positive bacteria)]|uniref:SDR family oxidoreductase n=1 Tax=Gordonia sp. (in: high G+C Gram-positive bacteria) TaxID=84139 RepID=UPI000FC0F60F|nr:MULTISPECIES: SDR family oxidoreductase [unclassified Gordonia (in: high G+C Gram-positive bacteria)]RUP38680.1 MAG: SDR family oxidoreductase [Gordonia sp. (in: high G+C Gram-positive bacteria)]HNP56237.1 SDR family oxidoreductase [Gordonia sp. (in: high G+C Gram-positive bacteria)]HRC51724.1 SDR family oxidoreductase [Gordonia sp. (in: high G+C Gram-positive bacteria)]
MNGSVAIVTGASRGIGLGVAKQLIAEGARVGITARKADELERAVAELGGPDHAIGLAGNATDTAHQIEAIEQVTETFGPVDILVNNTGMNPVYGPLSGLDAAAARKIVEVNCLAALSWTNHVVATGLRERGGAIVNVSSTAALKPAANIGFYGASKAMLSHLTQQLAVELAPTIRVNAVAPAVVKTKFAAALYEGRESDVASVYPLRRLGEPADIGHLVAFLASPRASWITGQTIVIDGGLTLTGGA